MRVIVAIDSRSTDDAPLQTARSLAWPEGTEIRLVSALEPIIAPLEFDEPKVVAAYQAAARRERAAALERAASGLAAPGRTVDFAVIDGDAADVIVAEALRTSADLVIVGSRGRGAVTSAILGSVSAAVVDRAPCAVLVARAPTVSKLIFADDGSPSAELAAALVESWPMLRTLPITVVSVVEPPPLLIGGGEMPVTETVIAAYDAAIADLRAGHRKVEQDRTRRFATVGMNVAGEVREGRAADEVRRCASEQGADLIVVGSRGLRGLRRLVLGSVARGVLYGATGSVLVVRGSSRVEDAGRRADETLTALV